MPTDGGEEVLQRAGGSGLARDRSGVPHSCSARTPRDRSTPRPLLIGSHMPRAGEVGVPAHECVHDSPSRTAG